MKLGISGQALAGSKSLEEIIKILKSFNVNNIELWPENVPFINGKTGLNCTYENKDMEAVKALLQQYEMNVACVTLGGAFCKELVDDEKRYADALVQTVKAAKFLGAKIVNHYCFYISMSEKPDFDSIKRYMCDAVQTAEELGIVLALENEAHDSTATPENMLRIIESMHSKSFKTNFDATNYYHASEEGFPYAYEVLKRNIAYVHIKNGCLYSDKFDYSLESKGTPMGGYRKGKDIYYPPIAQGAVNIDGMLLRLKADDYDGYCTLEPHTTSNNVEKYYEQEIDYLKRTNHF